MSLRIGFVGTGGIATQHLKRLSREDVQIAALCDIDRSKVEQAAAQYGAEAFTDYTEMFNKHELDAVFICTPPSFRKPPVQEAAKRRIACFIEKPPANNIDEAKEIKQIIEDTGIINGVGFMYRYSGAVEKARELIAGTQVPIVRSIFVCGAALNPNFPRWFLNKAVSGGPILDQAIHILDSSRYIVAQTSGDVAEVHSFGNNVLIPKAEDITIEDSQVINLRYQNGTIQNHIHSWAIAEMQVVIELLSNDFHLMVDLNPQPGRNRSALSGHIRGEQIHYDFTEEDFYVTEIQTFLRAVAQNDQSLIRSPYQDAAKTLQVVLSANLSVDDKKSIPLSN